MPDDLESEIIDLYLNNENSIFINDDLNKSTNIILDAITNYNNNDINKIYYREKFCENLNNCKEILRKNLSKILKNRNFEVEGKWYLDDLNFRLCNHGTVGSYTIIYDENKFFDWFNKVEKLNNRFIDEDHMYDFWFRDKPNFYQKLIIKFATFKSFIKKKIKNLIKS